jgi:hypothetical protein
MRSYLPIRLITFYAFASSLLEEGIEGNKGI